MFIDDNFYQDQYSKFDHLLESNNDSVVHKHFQVINNGQVVNKFNECKNSSCRLNNMTLINALSLIKFEVSTGVFQLEAIRPCCVYYTRALNDTLGFQPTSSVYPQVLRPQEAIGSSVSNTHYCDLARRMIDSVVANCDGVRILVRSDLYLKAWAKYIPLHNDSRLLAYGLPLGMTENCLSQKTVDNHTSATAYSLQVSEFLHKELQSLRSCLFKNAMCGIS